MGDAANRTPSLKQGLGKGEVGAKLHDSTLVSSLWLLKGFFLAHIEWLHHISRYDPATHETFTAGRI